MRLWRQSTSTHGSETGGDAPTPVTDRRCRELYEAVAREDEAGVLEIVRRQSGLIKKELDTHKRRLLHLAAARQQTRLIRHLFSFNELTLSALKKQDQAGNTPVHAAVESGNVATLKELVELMVTKEIDNIAHLRTAPPAQRKEAGANVALQLMELPNKMRQFPLHLAVLQGSEEMVGRLLHYGSKAFSKTWLDQDDVDPLKLSTKHNLTEVFRLLWYRLDDDKKEKAAMHQDKAGNTCLHYAARHNNQIVVEILLSRKTAAWNLRLKNKLDQNAAGVALACGHIELKEYLENWRRENMHTPIEDDLDQATTSSRPPCTDSSDAQSLNSSLTETTTSLNGDQRLLPRGLTMDYAPIRTGSSVDGSMRSEVLRPRDATSETMSAAASDLIRHMHPLTLGDNLPQSFHYDPPPAVVTTQHHKEAVEDQPSSSIAGAELEVRQEREGAEHAAKLQAVQDSIFKTQQRAAELQQELEKEREAEQQLQGLMAEIEEMQGVDRQAQTEMLLSLKAELPDLRRRNEQLEQELAELRQENEQFRAKQLELQERLQAGQGFNRHVQQQLEEQESLIRSLQNYINTANEEAAMLERAKTEADEQIQDLKQRLDEAMRNAIKIAQFHQGGRSLVVWACATSDADMLRFAIQAGCGVNEQNEDGNTGLHVACLNANEECVLLLLEANADANMFNQDGNTPLHLACSHQQASLVKLLLQHGADPSLENEASRTAWQEAIRALDFVALEAFLDFNAHFQVDFLFHSCRTGNVRLVQWLMMRSNVIVNAAQDGNTPLYVACEHQHVDLARILVQAGADIQARSANEDTALHVAANNQNVLLVAVLVQAGANIHATNAAGLTPLVMAATSQNMALIGAMMQTAPVNPVPPPSFVCPINLELMQDPYHAPDGWVYERAALQEWLARSSFSPITRMPMNFADCVPSFAVRGAIEQWRAAHPNYNVDDPAAPAQ